MGVAMMIPMVAAAMDQDQRSLQRQQRIVLGAAAAMLPFFVGDLLRVDRTQRGSSR